MWSRCLKIGEQVLFSVTYRDLELYKKPAYVVLFHRRCVTCTFRGCHSTPGLIFASNQILSQVRTNNQFSTFQMESVCCLILLHDFAILLLSSDSSLEWIFSYNRGRVLSCDLSHLKALTCAPLQIHS
jgi:hypothetical protein